MREIIFRGKTICEKKWVFGDLSFHVQNGIPYVFPAGGFDGANFYEVDPESVGQYIGLKDKKGKRIFEGDVVKYGNTVAVAIFTFGCFCFKAEKPDYLNRNCPAVDVVFNEYPNEIEIIGNIHDNPELLDTAKA